jgi:hypothetical protein
MKIGMFSCLFFGCFAVNPILLALSPSQAASYRQRMQNSDPAVRLAAISELGRLEERTPNVVGIEEIPIFCESLKDKDSKVRANAAADLAVIAIQTMPRLAPHKLGVPDLLTYGPLQTDIEAAMFDSDPEVRRSAEAVYLFTFNISADMQARLIRQYPMEDKTGLQPGIIEMLTSCESPTAATEDFLTHLLDDPKTLPFVIESFAKRPPSSRASPPPAAALPKLADMLINEKDSEKRQALVRAVGKYGMQARPYLAQIERLQDKESNPTTRSTLKAAADAIRAGKPLPGE